MHGRNEIDVFFYTGFPVWRLQPSTARTAGRRGPSGPNARSPAGQAPSREAGRATPPATPAAAPPSRPGSAAWANATAEVCDE